MEKREMINSVRFFCSQLFYFKEGCLWRSTGVQHGSVKCYAVNLLHSSLLTIHSLIFSLYEARTRC